MTGRRLLAVGSAVTMLLVVAGIASHGRPLSGGSGRGPSAEFFDYVATTLFVFAAAMLALLIWGLVTEPRHGRVRDRSPWYLLNQLLLLALGAAVGLLLLHTDLAKRLRNVADNAAKQQQQSTRRQDPLRDGRGARDPRFRWDEIAIVVALLGGTAVIVYARRRTRPLPRPFAFGRREAVVSDALDESLDDLRNDPDLRRAIVAAYARMERALAGVGLARRPAEAPFEYVERALTSLDASAAAARRLTGLFEWAKFSQHEPGPEMRDEAIAALVDVRDELRAPTAVLA